MVVFILLIHVQCVSMTRWNSVMDVNFTSLERQELT